MDGRHNIPARVSTVPRPLLKSVAMVAARPFVCSTLRCVRMLSLPSRANAVTALCVRMLPHRFSCYHIAPPLFVSF
jgi:hypothetical protein